jgi:hypothetical protein
MQIPTVEVCSASKGDLTAPKRDFRFIPESGLNPDIAPCPKSAITGSERASIRLNTSAAKPALDPR